MDEHMSAPIPQADLESAVSGIENAGAFATFVKKEQKSSELAWSNLRYTIKSKVGEPDKVVIDGCSGSVTPGKLTCVIGPSGAGKSSLLNVLAGRISTGGAHVCSGDISVNGKTIDPLPAPL